MWWFTIWGLFGLGKILNFSKKKFQKKPKNLSKILMYFYRPNPQKKFSKSCPAPNPSRTKDDPTSKLTSIISTTPTKVLTLDPENFCPSKV
jgi:hypothetical protein